MAGEQLAHKKIAQEQYNSALYNVNQDVNAVQQARDAQVAIQNGEDPDAKKAAKQNDRDTVEQTKPDKMEQKAARQQAREEIANNLRAGFKDAGTAAMAKAGEIGNNIAGYNTHFSDSFYRDVGASFAGRPTGNELDKAADTARRQAQNMRNDSANRQMEAQRSAQIANRNEYSEAGKIASVQNDAQNRQNIQNTQGLSGSAAAKMRQSNAPDVQAQQQRQDQQRQVANERGQAADTAQQNATQLDGWGAQMDVESRDYDNDINTSGRLAMGEGGSEQTNPTDNNTGTDNTDTDNTDNTEQETTTPDTGKVQHVINALLGSSKGQDIRDGTSQEGMDLYNWAISQGVKSVPTDTYWEKSGHDPDQYETLWLNDPNTGDKATKQRVIDALRQGRAGEGNDPRKNFSGKEYDEMAQRSMNVPTSNPPSDARVKDIHEILSDERMKWIRDNYDSEGFILPDDIEWLAKRAGKLKFQDKEYDYDTDWTEKDEPIVKAYADHIRNYVYNYKPEAQAIDPSIDPNEEHIGPMAQDIEQVNPACVNETPEGVKTVDTDRLAMMNAGAIGDLARQLQDVVNRLNKLGV